MFDITTGRRERMVTACAAGATVVATMVHPLAGAAAAVAWTIAAWRRDPGLGRGAGATEPSSRHEAENRREAEVRALGDEACLGRTFAAFEDLSDAVVVFDGLGDVAFANPAAQELWRAPGSFDRSLHSHSFEQVFADDGLTSIAEDLRALLEGRSSTRKRHSGVARGRRILDIELLRSGEGAAASAVCIAHDVTDRHEAARLKDTFLSSVSHELKTPLTNICAYVEILQSMGPEEPEWREFLDIVNGESQRLSRHVQALLDFARIRAGHVVWRVERTDLRQKIEEARQLFAARAKEEGTDLVVEDASLSDLTVSPQSPEPAPVPCSADGAWLLRALSELLDNALKFAQGGKVTVRLEPGTACHRISVLDTGCGVTVETGKSIFDELVQGGGILSDKPDGIGLGLPLARAAVDACGGSLESVPMPDGEPGAWFRLTLPAEESAETAVEPSATGG